MGPCKECGQWHCVCDLIRQFEENRAQYQDIIYEHRTGTSRPRNDPAFERFMRQCLGDKSE